MNLPSSFSQILRTSRGLLGGLTAVVARRLPLEKWTPSLAWIYRMNIPRNVQGNQVLSAVGGSNINIILHFLQITQDIAGDIAECGVYKGGSILTMGLYLRQRNIPKKIIGFDSFEGFSQAVELDQALGGELAWGKEKGGYGDTSFSNLQNRIDCLGLAETVSLRPGFFANTLVHEIERNFSFVHLDCDLYDSYKTCLEYFYPRMQPGGVILIDEYDDPPWPGCNKAVDEFLHDKPEKLARIERDNQIKYYITRA